MVCRCWLGYWGAGRLVSAPFPYASARRSSGHPEALWSLVHAPPIQLARDSSKGALGRLDAPAAVFGGIPPRLFDAALPWDRWGQGE